MNEIHTAVGDVKASAGHGVVGLELQTEDVAVAGEVGGNLGPSEAAQDSRVQQLTVLHCQDVIRSLQIKVVEGQMDAATWL